jgi:hypothetical protein
VACGCFTYGRRFPVNGVPEVATALLAGTVIYQPIAAN